MHHAFLYISLPSLHDYNVKLLNLIIIIITIIIIIIIIITRLNRITISVIKTAINMGPV